MRIQLMGYKDTDFVNPEGKTIQGRNLYFPSPITTTNGKGFEVGKKFVSVDNILYDKLPELEVNKLYDCDFSDKGHLLSIVAVK